MQFKKESKPGKEEQRTEITKDIEGKGAYIIHYNIRC